MVRPRAWRSGRARRALGGRARFLSLQFQTELRKILLSLIEVAQKLLALSPGAVELFTKANAMLDEDEDERVDEAALRQLTEMGFPEGRAAKALRLNQYVGPSPPGRGAWSPGAPRR